MWHNRNCIRVDAERLYTIDIGRLVPQLRIPSFQRGYVWSAREAVALIESIMLGYPIGSIILWDPSDGSWGLSSDKLIVLDGQQRLTTIAGAVIPGGFGNAVRVAYDVEVDAFVAIDGDPTPDQIPISDVRDFHKLGNFLAALADRHPGTWRPQTSKEEVESLRAAIWARLAPGRPLPRTKKDLRRLDQEIRAHESAKSAAWEEAHPERTRWVRRLDFVERRLREHQTSVTVVRGGTLVDACEVFKRINTTGRPIDEAGVAALLGENRE